MGRNTVIVADRRSGVGNRKYERRKNIQSVGSEGGAEVRRADAGGGAAVGGDQMSGTGNRGGGESAGGKLKQLIQKLPYHIIGIAGAVGESRKVPPQRADK